MSRYCEPKGGPALYTECLECEDKERCETDKRMNGGKDIMDKTICNTDGKEATGTGHNNERNAELVEDEQNMPLVRIIIAGSRNFQDDSAQNYKLLRRVLSELAGNIPKERLEIITGGAKGADRLGEIFAKRNNLKLTVMPAEWDKYGKSAGYIRNKSMADYAGPGSTLIAFWDGKSPGTKHMINTAMDSGAWVRVIRVDKEHYGMDHFHMPAFPKNEPDKTLTISD